MTRDFDWGAYQAAWQVVTESLGVDALRQLRVRVERARPACAEVVRAYEGLVQTRSYLDDLKRQPDEGRVREWTRKYLGAISAVAACEALLATLLTLAEGERSDRSPKSPRSPGLGVEGEILEV